MNRFRVSVVGSVLFLVVVVTCVLMASHKSAAGNPSGGPDVSIVSPLPLPVTGTLGLAAGSAVTVDNPASSPVLVRDVDRGTPFQIYKTASQEFVVFGQVPPGKRWVIEHVSSAFSISQPQTLGVSTDFRLFTDSNPAPTEFFIPQVIGPTLAITNSQTKFIVNSSEQLALKFEGATTDPSPRITALISGVIVPAQ